MMDSPNRENEMLQMIGNVVHDHRIGKDRDAWWVGAIHPFTPHICIEVSVCD
jgi:hypothetical protein